MNARAVTPALAAAAVLAVGLMSIPSAAAAATTRYVAIGGSDSGDCSSSTAPCKTIQHAIDAASDGATVRLAAGRYVQSAAVRGKSLTITGASRSATTVTGDQDGAASFTFNGSAADNDVVQDLSVAGNRYAAGLVTGGVHLVVSDIALSKNVGAFYSDHKYSIRIDGGTVALRDSTVVADDGAGIYATAGAVTVTGSTLQYGSPNIDVAAGVDLTVEHSKVLSGFYADGIDQRAGKGSGSMTISNSVVRDSDYTGVLESAAGATLSIANSQILHNAFDPDSDDDDFGGSGIYVMAGSATILNTSVTDNHGAGLIVGDSGSARVRASTLSRNDDTGLSVSGTASVGRSTMYANARAGVESYYGGKLAVTASTISATKGKGGPRNERAGAVNDRTHGPSTLSLRSSIVSGSTAPDCRGTVSDGGHNLSRDKANSCRFSKHKHDVIRTDPLLGGYGRHGGPTATRVPRTTSPVVNVIPFGAVTCVNGVTDQRGVPRPQAKRCEIGSVERKK